MPPPFCLRGSETTGFRTGEKKKNPGGIAGDGM